MNRLILFFSSHARAYRFVFFLALVLLLASTYQRVINLDESWIGEQAYWAAKEGVVRSELFRGFIQAEIRQLVYHKLFVWQGAGMVRLLGWSVLSLRLLSVLYLMLFGVLSYRYLQTLGLRNPRTATFLFFSLLLINALVVEFSFMFRPELMLMSLGFASWVCLEQARPPERRLLYCIGAGALAGLAALTHLNGLIFVVAGGGVLLWRRNLAALVGFGLPVLVCVGLYFLEVVVTDSWAAFCQQLQPAMKQEGTTLWGYVERLLQEHKRLFHSSKEASLSVFALLAGYVLFRLRATFPAGWLTEVVGYTVLLIAALACIGQNRNSFYTVLYIPFLVLLITLAFDRLSVVEGNRPLSAVMGGLYGLYVVLNCGNIFYLINLHQDTVRQNRLLAQHLAPYQGKRVVAPLSFVFNEIGRFQIQGTFCYHLLATNGFAGTSAQSPLWFFNRAAEFQRQVLLLDDESLKVLQLPRPAVAGQQFGQYRFSHQFQRFYIYEALPPALPR
ncbi:hypothetical protein GCM10027346_13010 [Hymenobacter seoulensis]